MTDVGVNLRLPPTNGETSAALLNLLASGVPTVVTDVATFSDYPSSVVRKVRWETDGPDGLLRAMHGLGDRPGRAARRWAVSAWDYVDESPRVVARDRPYVEAIELCHEAAAWPTGSRPDAGPVVRATATAARDPMMSSPSERIGHVVPRPSDADPERPARRRPRRSR